MAWEKKMNDVEEDLGKTSGRPPTFSAAFRKNLEKRWSTFRKKVSNFLAKLRKLCKKSAKF